jgi:CheY-like chemotaxis protein
MATILVVDDHLPTRELVRSLLQYRKHRVILAEHAPGAIVAAAEERPDLIVCDVVMPGMDGYTLLRMLREHTPCKDPAVLFMSASLEEQKARSLAEKCGGLGYLAKPFEPEELLRAVDAALAGAVKAS